MTEAKYEHDLAWCIATTYVYAVHKYLLFGLQRLFDIVIFYFLVIFIESLSLVRLSSYLFGRNQFN